jgi:hypothetical protein
MHAAASACRGRDAWAPVDAQLMQPPCRNRWRFNNSARSHCTALVALVLAVLMSMQIATTTVARLLWPAHTHVAANAQRRDANIDSSCRFPGACADENGVSAIVDRLPSSLEKRSTAASEKHGHATVLARVTMLPHPDRLRAWLKHADVHLPIRTTRHTSPAEAGSGDEEEHSHIDDLAHALAHTAGVGHHRHAIGTVGVVYVDDDIPQLPAKLLIRHSDISLLPPLYLLLPSRAGTAVAPPGPPSIPLAAQYATPGDRPPR